MRSMNPIALCIAAAMAMLLGTGCLVVSDSSGECYEYEVCDTYCDSYACWEECRWVEADTCEGFSGGGGSACSADSDCQAAYVCVSGTCRPPDTEEQGSAGLCQACETHDDCADPLGRCAVLNPDAADPVRTCTRSCSSGSCPTGFECIPFNSSGGDLQCVPVAQGGVRSCENVGGGGGLECTSAADCAAGYSCVNNTCTPPDGAECHADDPCPSGQTCRDFVCESDNACVDNTDCGTGEVCFDGECQATSESCVFNSECSGDARCVDGQCRNTCTDDSQCSSLERCSQGLCKPTECTENTQCSAGEVCVDARCIDSCNTSSDCDAGYVCDGLGFCKPDQNIECRSNAECRQDEVCDGGECKTPCGCNQDCLTAGQVCNMDTGLCEDPATEPSQCEDNCDCPSGEVCTDGACVAP